MSILVWLMQYSIVAMVAVFLLIVVTTYWPGRKARFQRDSMIPLQDDRSGELRG